MVSVVYFLTGKMGKTCFPYISFRTSAIERYMAENPQKIPTTPANTFDVPVKSAKLSRKKSNASDAKTNC